MSVEAVIAAIYLDGGLDAAFAFVERHWAPLIAEMEAAPPRDPKTTLQEWAQGRGLGLPDYRLVETSGPDHARHFTVAVAVKGQEEASATARSKRAAETAAAAVAAGAAGRCGQAKERWSKRAQSPKARSRRDSPRPNPPPQAGEGAGEALRQSTPSPSCGAGRAPSRSDGRRGLLAVPAAAMSR